MIFRMISAVAIALFLASPLLAEEKGKDGYGVATSTKIDFEEALIEGQFKAPDEFLITGKTPMKIRQMVKLRANFRERLKASKAYDPQ